MRNQGATLPPLSPHSPPPAPGPQGRWPPIPAKAGGASPLPPEGPQGPGGGTQQGLSARRLHAPNCLLPRGPRQGSKPEPARNDATRTTPRDNTRTQTGAVWGPALHGQRDAKTPALLPAQKRQRDGLRQGAQAAPPPPWPRRPAPREAHNPKPGRAETGPGRPPPDTSNGARHRGKTPRGAQTAWNGPTGSQHRDRARCARHTDPGRGGGMRTP